MPLVEFSVDAGIAHVTLNRPDKRNALSPALLDALQACLRRAKGRDVRALLLRGNGPVFSAGGDIDAMQDRLGEPRATLAALRAHLNPAVLAVHGFPAPTVAAVQGAAVGAGLGLALACDVVVATEGAKLGAVQARLGLTPDGGTSWLLPRLVGPKRALDMVLRAETITGAEAAGQGMVSRAVARDQLDAVAEGLALDLARGPTRAYLLARQLVHGATGTSLAQALEQEAHAQAMAYATLDHEEGVAAFLDKREAAFRGR